MRRLLSIGACVLAALAVVPAHAAVVTTVKGSSQFALDRPSQDPLQYDKLAISFSDVRSQSVADYPPVGAGTATLTFTDFNQRAKTIPLTIYNMTVTDGAAGSRHVTFSGLSNDNRCFTGLVVTGSAATVHVAFGALPCDALTTAYSGTGTTSLTFTQT